MLGAREMRFCSTISATPAPTRASPQLETGFGLLLGAGGLQYLVNLIGRARALEYVLSGNVVNAIMTAQIDWMNKVFASAEDLRKSVEALAR